MPVGPEPTPAPNSQARWVFAVLLLLVVCGFGTLAGFQVYGWYHRSDEANARRAELDAARADLARIRAEHESVRLDARKELDPAVAAEERLRADHRAALDAARKAIEAKDFQVRLTGPARVQPGAPNTWQIETLTAPAGAPARPKKLEVAVKDSNGTEIFRQAHDHPPGVAPLVLPVDVWERVKPGTELFLEVVAFTDDDRKSTVAERLPLSRPVYVTHLVTDKPLYRPGEVVRFRSLTLDRATLRPPAHDLHLKFRLRDPGDAVVPLDEGNGRVLIGLQPVLGPDKQPLRGIGVGEYAVGADAPGGEYKLDLFEQEPGSGREVLLDTRKFLVNRYVPDVFEKKLEFDGKSYGAGDVVQARVEVSRTAGGPMKDAKATVVAGADGRTFHEQKDAKFTLVTDNGTAKAVLDLRFTIPADVYENASSKDAPPNATLSVNIRDGSDAEAIVRPIPLVARTLKVAFFPEGGEMVEGVQGRVYFQVRTPHGKPADLKGYVTDGKNKVADVATVTDAENPGVNRGQGVFSLTPKAGSRYYLKLTSPAGIIEPTGDGFPLPVAKPDGVALTALDPVTEKGAPIRMRLETPKGPKTLHVGAYARGVLIGHRILNVGAGKPVEVVLDGDSKTGGVTRVTVFEEPKPVGPLRAQLVPRAERLVYRKPGEQLMLNVNPDKARYTPAGKVKLELSAYDEAKKPTPAVLLVGVVNQSVVTMADIKTDRLMPTHFLLSRDIKDPAELEHADFLLTDHPKAGVALDLLLATQGWRRFVEQTHAPADPAERADIDRLLVAHGLRTSAPLELFKLEEQRVNAEFRPRLEVAALRRVTAESAWADFQNKKGPELAAQASVTQARMAAAEKAFEEAAVDLYKTESRPLNPRSWALPLCLVGLLGLTVGGTALAMRGEGGSRRPFVIGAAFAFALCPLVAGAIWLTRGTPDTAVAWERTRERDRREMMARADAEADRAMMAGEANVMRAPKAGRGAQAERPAMPPVFAAEGAPPMGGLDPLVPAAPGAIKPMPGPAQPKPDGNLAEAVRPVADKVGRAEQLRRDRALVAGLARPEPRIAGGGRAGPGRPAVGMAMPAGGGMPAPRDADLADEFRPQPVVPPFVVREYAHRRDPALGETRSDFTETVYWHPVLVLPESGKATVEFQLSDDIARYQVLVAGHTPDGRIGAVTKTIEARKPFSVDPKLPLELSHTDAVDVPVRVTNDSDERRAVGLVLTPRGFKFDGPPTADGKLASALDLAPNGKGRKVVRLTPNTLDGDAGLLVEGTSGPDKDTISRTIRVVPDGFPVVGSFSDTMEGRARGTVTLPKDVVPGTLRVRFEMYPTSMAELVKGLDGLLREPYGCFEQASTSNYPNTLILDYLSHTNQANPEASARAKRLLESGYAKLVSFECPDSDLKARRGFEWFGAADQQHEALTAYGLLQLKDMARVHPVDPQLIKRTQSYLLSRRDGNGGFKRNTRALDQFGGAPDHTTNAYIVWALVESDPEDAEKLDLKKEIDALKTQALDGNSAGGKDAYYVALTANVLLLRGDRAAAHTLLDRLKDKHAKTGAVGGAVTSITRSGGRDLEIETTALALLGWLRANDPKYATAAKEAIRWISQQRGGYGGFGSTQSTILALKALSLHAAKSKHPSESGTITVSVGGRSIGARKFSEKDVEVIGLDVEKPEEFFKPGESTEVEVTTDAKQAYPFALTYTYTTRTPASAEKCAVRIGTRLARKEAGEGETIPLSVTVENLRKQDQGMAVAIVGLPAGLKVPTDLKQLTDLREQGRIAYFETRGRELILYWRGLKPEQKIELSVDLVCEVPGEYRGPASRAYLYYDADHKHWVEPLSVKVTPMAEGK